MIRGQNKEFVEKVSNNIIRFIKACYKLGKCRYKEVVGAIEMWGRDAIYDEYRIWVKDEWKIYRLKYQENDNPILSIKSLLGRKILNVNTNSGAFYLLDKDDLNRLLSILDDETVSRYEVEAESKRQEYVNKVDKILEEIANDQGSSYEGNDLPDMYEP
jgi:hypothetical protein